MIIRYVIVIIIIPTPAVIIVLKIQIRKQLQIQIPIIIPPPAVIRRRRKIIVRSLSSSGGQGWSLTSANTYTNKNTNTNKDTNTNTSTNAGTALASDLCNLCHSFCDCERVKTEMQSKSRSNTFNHYIHLTGDNKLSLGPGEIILSTEWLLWPPARPV